MQNDIGARNLEILLCEQYFELPFGVIKPGVSYGCDDKSQRLTHQRYTNQGDQCCFYKDYLIECYKCNIDLQYIAKSKVSVFSKTLTNHL